MSGNQGSTAGAGAQPSPHQDRLSGFCREQNVRTPNYQVISDRRGGRTAWSCVVTVQGANFPARFWYDGQYVNNAREDAAEKALQTLGVIASPPPRPAHLQHQQQHQPQQPQQQHQYQQSSRFYGGAINS
ncbi:unnamed protein product [Zymoseptoria tritici ST99CH_1A5]|uniref:DRBM domain-containing protein n=3 Tax=Zymoseptoria tritici TaxID=1047171 RepID=A0A1X7RU85_ZYMT9|nr:unnamed protein product [Zymoseptoria tritici ST99CH_3D7]SMR52905.1 unnamed protein product [Zymoseptoria tritici ST99CH_1E4]SMR54336.1 unnamed protein product [Zymoseptoria tritici ST99CH_3D1]SMY24650.1 unnamed protein product [Zymoseptoria tritici ST99CH_1A5]